MIGSGGNTHSNGNFYHGGDGPGHPSWWYLLETMSIKLLLLLWHTVCFYKYSKCTEPSFLSFLLSSLERQGQLVGPAFFCSAAPDELAMVSCRDHQKSTKLPLYFMP
jgi:hypothetical protein